jgi:hypothetical protein
VIPHTTFVDSPVAALGFTRSTTKPSVGFVEYGTNATASSDDGGDGSSAPALNSFFVAALSALF